MYKSMLEILKSQPAMLSSSDTILCIGSEYGDDIDYLKRLGHDATGIHPNAKYAHITKLPFVPLPYPNDCFELVTLQLSHYMNQLEELLREAIRVLSSPGHLLVAANAHGETAKNLDSINEMIIGVFKENDVNKLITFSDSDYLLFSIVPNCDRAKELSNLQVISENVDLDNLFQISTGETGAIEASLINLVRSGSNSMRSCQLIPEFLNAMQEGDIHAAICLLENQELYSEAQNAEIKRAILSYFEERQTFDTRLLSLLSGLLSRSEVSV